MSQSAYEPAEGATSQFGRALVSLREMVLRGEFKAGERLLTVPLAERLGVSRTPIRLALERLAHEGILETGTGSSFTVREFTVGDIWDAVEARGVLEGAAARLAAERLSDPVELEPLWAVNDELRELARMGMNPDEDKGSDAVVRYAELNETFHSGVVDLAKSKMMRWSLDRVQTIPFVSPGAAIIFPVSIDILTLSIDHHHCILESIRNREGSRAENLAREHARLVRRNLEGILEGSSDLAHMPGAPMVRIRV
jgi:GntR family transcriptional regulator of vanillate catabolism